MVNIDIREQLRSWSQYTYAEGIRISDYELKDELIDLLWRDNGLDSAKMDGRSLCGLESADEVDICLSKEFQDAFRFQQKSQNALVNYIAWIYEHLRSTDYENCSLGEKIRVLNKALFSFQSFIREMDLAYKLEEYFDPEECYRSLPEKDIEEHTDIVFVFKGKSYRVWSYCSSVNEAMTMTKLEGKHGQLPSGLHMLCPIDIYNDKQIEEVAGWKLYSAEYIKEIEQLINQGQIIDYDVLKGNLRSYVGQMTLFEVK